MTLRSPFYNFHIFSFSLGFISGFNNHLINIHLKISRKIPKLAQLYPEYIIIFIIKILRYFWGVTEKVLKAMEITFDTTRIRLAVFQLEGEAQVWWNWAKTSRDLKAMTWAEFQELFMGKYFSDTTHHAKAQEFLELKHGTMRMMEYVARFTELARFSDDYVATDMAKVRRFENGIKLSIRGRIVGLRLQDMDSMVGTTLTIEREIKDAQSTRDAGVSSKRKESQSFSSSGKKQKASSSRGFQSRDYPS